MPSNALKSILKAICMFMFAWIAASAAIDTASADGDYSLSRSRLSQEARKLIYIQSLLSDQTLKSTLVFNGKPHSYKTIHQTNPPQILIELPGVQSVLDRPPAIPDNLIVGKIRVDQNAQGIQVVFDLTSLADIKYLITEENNRIEVTFNEPFIQIKSIDAERISSEKSVLKIATELPVRFEVHVNNNRNISLVLLKTALPENLQKQINLTEIADSVKRIEPRISKKFPGAVEFEIELSDSFPYSVKTAGNEIYFEINTSLKSGSIVDQQATAPPPPITAAQPLPYGKSEEEMAVAKIPQAESSIDMPAPENGIKPAEETGDNNIAAAQKPGAESVTSDNITSSKTEEVKPPLPSQQAEMPAKETPAEAKTGLAQVPSPEASTAWSGVMPSGDEALRLSGGGFRLDDMIDEMANGFSYDIRALLYQSFQNPSNSTINPNNAYGIPETNIQLDLRPDFFLNYRDLSLFVKPRLSYNWSHVDEGIFAGETDLDSDFYVNEWLARLSILDSLSVSYGRENLQWGPSFLVSPSNPFFRNNGRSNPMLEVRGLDFGRVVWVPSSSWTASFIANTDKGVQEFIDDFESIYALKLDYTGNRKYFSLIASYRDTDRPRLGAFGGWTVADGLLLYAEGNVAEGTAALYPVETSTIVGGQPLIQMEPTQDDSNDLEALALLGASYTFEAGPTFTFEFALNSAGYNDKDAELAVRYGEQNGRALLLEEILGLPFPLQRDIFVNNELKLLRKYYGMFQFQYANIRNVLSIILRYTYNFDDESSQLIPLLQYDLGDRTQLFLIGNQNFGSKDSEFMLFVDYYWMFGVQYIF